MKNERKAITVRVSSDLKFQIEKATIEEGFSTVNSWVIHVLRKHLDEVKK